MKKKMACFMAVMLLGAASFTGASAEADTSAAAEITLPTTGIGTSITTDLEANEEYKIACIVKNSTNPYMMGCINGVKKAGEDMGFEAITMAPSTNDSVEEQIKIMEDLIESGVDGFVLVPVDSNGIMPGVRKAKEAGIPIVCIGTPAAEETFMRTGVDYTETGRVIAEKVAEELGGKGTVIILEGPPGAQNAIERLNGINEVLDIYPDIEVVASQTANFKRTEGINVTENLIQKYGDVSAIIACNDESALGAYQAVKAAGMEDVVIVGFDGNQDASAAIQNGELFASYNTDPYGSCYVASAYLVQYLNDGTEPEENFIPFPSERDDPVITSESVDNYIENIAWWKTE
ncbi:MAG: sugar ABC transporter substrate-binding protein [Eubacteriales bacterium]|nr:sugar ABC transporter substrate-binding protein [Eubacteriales bacterium]